MFGLRCMGGVAALALLSSLTLSVRASDDLPLLWNSAPDRASCNDPDSALWVESASGESCIRYFSGEALEGAPVVIVMFHGDRDKEMRQAPELIAGNTVAAKDKQAATLSRRAHVPVVIVARPGTYGSSGNHLHRRQASEFQPLDAALDALRARYSIGRFVLLGHSGGATAVAALLTLGREDVQCAVMTSGAFDLLKRARMVRQKRGLPPREGRDTNGLLNPYDPLEHVDGIAKIPGQALFVIGNPEDQITPFALQQNFFAALLAAGLPAQLIDAPAVSPTFHHLRNDIGLKTAARCARP